MLLSKGKRRQAVARSMDQSCMYSSSIDSSFCDSTSSDQLFTRHGSFWVILANIMGGTQASNKNSISDDGPSIRSKVSKY
ncbi:hypothetical protein COCNU_06G006490 [Cocos nucifera]|uniref:Uncharacterized protein n=1 Tax=Cocos nucifera TaxID=13894 RepID=A0A8K0IBC7_COCNU|nr:hypothetical protein COCNU_06G006490 [Cocos nucifera]